MIRIKRDFATENLVPGQLVYGERIMRRKGKEFRIWDPKRSKVGASLQKGMRIPLKDGMKILYLGVASGTTASHISDEVPNGMIYGVDPAPRVLREFLLLSETRKNLVPILRDANRPETYKHLVPEVDFLIQDVAQPNQAQIFLKNVHAFLKKGGYAFVAVKARSIDVTANPKKVFKAFKHEIKELKIIEEKSLEPFERDHLAILIQK